MDAGCPVMFRPGANAVSATEFVLFCLATSSNNVSTKATQELILKLVLHYSFRHRVKTGPKYSTALFRTSTFHRYLEAGDVYTENTLRGVRTKEVTSRLVV